MGDQVPKLGQFRTSFKKSLLTDGQAHINIRQCIRCAIIHIFQWYICYYDIVSFELDIVKNVKSVPSWVAFPYFTYFHCHENILQQKM